MKSTVRLLAALAPLLLCCGGARALTCYTSKATCTISAAGGWCLNFHGEGTIAGVRGGVVKMKGCDDGTVGCRSAGCRAGVKVPDFLDVKDAVGELCCCDDDKCNGGGIAAGRLPAALLAAALAALAHHTWWC